VGVVRTLSLDLETFSSVDLPSCGVHKYAASPDFEILLFGYAFDDDPVRVIDLAHGEEIPEELFKALWDPGVEKRGWNLAFERNCLREAFGREIPPEQCFDTMILAASCGLPATLEAAGAALGLSEDQAKMKVGKQLIREFSIPCKPTKKNGEKTRILPEDDPENWALYKQYNQRDVETEMTICKRLLRWRPIRSEQSLWCLDQRINDLGIRVDINLAANAIRIGGEYKAKLIEEAVEISGLENPNSTAQVKAWLEEQEGITVSSLNKKVIADVVANLSEHNSKRFMALRSEFSKSSVKKYEAITRGVCLDGHVKGTFQFYGAGRTGRWAGRRLQLQNLAKNNMPDLDLARQIVSDGDGETLELLYPNVQSTLSELIRTALIPEEGHRFIVADYSAIEARVLAWLAGEQWRLDVFTDGGDIYCASASQMFKVPVVKHGENGHLRQKGKVAELACIAKDQLVLTDCGLVPIQEVTTGMKVWDGENWVSHGGVVFKGIKEVIEYEGLRATDDHLVWVEGKSRPICFGAAAESGAHVVETGDGREAIRLGGDYKPTEAVEREDEPLLGSDQVYRMRERTVVGPRKSPKRKKPWLSVLFPAKESPDVAVQEDERGKAEMRESREHHVSGVRRPWYLLLFSKCERSLPVHDGSWSSESGSRDRQNRYERELRTRESSMGHPCRELLKSTKERLERVGSEVLAIYKRCCSQEAVSWRDAGTDHRGRQAYRREQGKELAYNRGQVEVYDIRDAGPNHRFTVSGKLVHNCGYGGGIGALKAFGADKMGMSEEDMAETIEHWRAASPHIVAMWKDLERAAIRCVVKKVSTISTVGHIRFDYEDGVLWMNLPSGRRIAYWGAEYSENRKGYKSLTYMGTDQKTRKWTRLETWGGKLVENLTQATARDCLKESMLALTGAGFDIRAHVHDEVIITEPIGGRTVEDVCQIMGAPISWAPGLPLRADGYETPYYKKD
jgi:DNA polymerase